MALTTGESGLKSNAQTVSSSTASTATGDAATMTNAFQLRTPLPRRRSVQALRAQLIEHLLETAPAVGSRFMSEHELTRLTKLSRPTVRRVLEHLSKEGWIERRQGSGTFVGPRIAMVGIELSDPQDREPRPVRLAVMINLLGDLAHDWYSRGVLVGLDREAYSAGISIELLGDHAGDLKQLSGRLMRSRPDVVALIAPPPQRLPLIGECRRLDIRATGTGGFLASLGIPSVQEDGVQGAAMAVKHLVAHGHRRIGLVMPPYPVPWVFSRRQGYISGLAEAGIEHDEGLVLWAAAGEDEQGDANLLLNYLQQRRPTALLFGSYGGVRLLAPLLRSGDISIPQDLSIIHFDQSPETQYWLNGLKPTIVGLPLEEMGRSLAEMTRRVMEQDQSAEEPHLPCVLLHGHSVGAPSTTA